MEREQENAKGCLFYHTRLHLFMSDLKYVSLPRLFLSLSLLLSPSHSASLPSTLLLSPKQRLLIYSPSLFYAIFLQRSKWNGSVVLFTHQPSNFWPYLDGVYIASRDVFCLFPPVFTPFSVDIQSMPDMHLHLTKEEGELGAVACGKHAFIAFSLTPRTGLTSKAKECISVLFTKAFRFFPLYSIARKLMVARRGIKRD